VVQDSLVPPLEGEPDRIVADDQMVEFFELDVRRKRADRAGHFVNCCWAIVEAKTRYKIPKAVEQLKETADQIDQSKFPICHFVVVYDSLGPEGRLFEVVDRGGKKILWNKVIPRGGPVLIRDKEVIALKPKEIKAMYEQSRLGTDQ